MTQLNPENFSKSDFADILKASYMNQREAADYMGQRGYDYDKLLSTNEEKVFVNRATGKPIISERGSVRISDWLWEDPRLITYGGQFGGDTRRVANAKQLSKNVEEKYQVAPAFASHSLGGYLSERAARPNSEVFTYNKAAGLPSIFGSTPKNQYDYRTSLDIPSALSQFQFGNRTTLPGSWSPIDSHDLKYLK